MATAFYIAGREKFAVTEEILFANLTKGPPRASGLMLKQVTRY